MHLRLTCPCIINLDIYLLIQFFLNRLDSFISNQFFGTVTSLVRATVHDNLPVMVKVVHSELSGSCSTQRLVVVDICIEDFNLSSQNNKISLVLSI